MFTISMKAAALAASTALLPTTAIAQDNGGAGRDDAQVLSMTSEPTTINVRNVGEVEGTEVTLMVPENRSNPESRTIALRYVVLEAVNPGDAAPVVYLAGGPGGSATGTAQGPRWPLFDAMRQSRDVILLDQRGTGRSESPPPCQTTVGWTPDEAPTRATSIAKQREALDQCLAFWTEQGVDLAGYTTSENAADIAAVSKALGTPVDLVGISYGTHLAMAAMKEQPASINRVVLASVEGLDQTVKLPARTDAFIARLEAALTQSAGETVEIAAPLRRALDRIEQTRPQVLFNAGRGQPRVQRTLAPFAVQRAISFALSDPERAGMVVNAIRGMNAEEPNYDFMGFFGFLLPDQMRMRAMPTIMDLASGISPERLALVEEQRKTALLSDGANFPMPHLNNTAAPYYLPDTFRADPVSDIPTLVLSGTLDGRTYPEAAIEATAGLSDKAIITVENAGHNLFLDTPEIVPMVVEFLDGAAIEDTILTAPLPRM